ncbi:MAG: TIGR04282 family arsenosugar biosynthesis glycosyltransferase [Betaproteobacteria bacterium]|nr:TIGR04282 family arsenosugar biosynthesis glycosyltransferase [Betaproteobacteria bacterium]
MAAAVTFQLFAKSPVPGSVKTRLIPALDARDAATLHARMVEHAARAIALARAAIPGADAEMWCSPDVTDPILRAIAARHGLRLQRQAADGLGARMREALESALPGRAILLGSDCPALDARTLIAADRALLAHDAVFVPVEDGGYALIGCRDAVPDCLDGIAWSAGAVMTRTRVRLAAAGVRWAELPGAWDVDTAADLARLAADARFTFLVEGLHIRDGAETRRRTEQTL